MIDFIEKLSLMLKQIYDKNKTVYIIGDFNINLLNAGSHSNTSDFIDMMFGSSYIPLINSPTSISETNATLIDNIFLLMH